MARRKGWEQLSDRYRARLERGGITRQDYEGNIPLDIARGHGATPEHGLDDAIKNPAKWADYIQEHRDELEPQHIAKMQDLIRNKKWPSWAFPKEDWSFLYYHKQS